jgi:general secretion pathway protein G
MLSGGTFQKAGRKKRGTGYLPATRMTVESAIARRESRSLGAACDSAPCDADHLPDNSTRRPDAFTLIEILIVVVILGILAAIVIPHFSNASTLARENTMKDELRYLRTQVIVFKAQHADQSPGYKEGAIDPTGGAFVEQLTQYTNEACDTVATADTTHPFGPYLSQMPANPVNGKSDVLVTTDDPKTKIYGAHGWIYNPQTLEIVPDLEGSGSDGVAYANY